MQWSAEGMAVAKRCFSSEGSIEEELSKIKQFPGVHYAEFPENSSGITLRHSPLGRPLTDGWY